MGRLRLRGGASVARVGPNNKGPDGPGGNLGDTRCA